MNHIYTMANLLSRPILFCYAVSCLAACNDRQSFSKKEVDEIKSQHQFRLAYIRHGYDPYAHLVPDSMKHWIKYFAEVLAEDQKYRIPVLSMSAQESVEQAKIDSINIIKASYYLEKYGWPEKKKSGFVVQEAVGMVIQHASLPVQEKYYPMLTRAFINDRSLFEFLALMEDRINVTNKRPQYYGTQVKIEDGRVILYPVVNVDSLDAFRSKLGSFVPIATYMSMFKAKWDPVKYKRDLPKLKADLGFTDSPGIRFIPKAGNKIPE